MPLTPTAGKSTNIMLSQYDVSQWFNAASYQLQSDLAETTAFGASSQSFLPGYPGGTITMGGMFDGLSSPSIDTILNTIVTGSTNVPLTIAPQGNAAGNRAMVANVLNSNYHMTSPVNGIAAIDTAWTYFTKVNAGFLVQPTTAISATGTTTTGVDFGITTSVGGVMALHMTANTRDAGSIAIKLQDATTLGGAYSDVTGATFTAVNFGVSTSQFVVIPATTTIREFVKAAWTVTAGASGTYTFAVSVAKTNA